MADGGQVNDSGQGGQGGGEFNPVEARTFLQQFGHPVDKIADTDLPTIYGTVKENADKLAKNAVETAFKERGDFGPTWRQSLAGEDTDALKTLERFNSPRDVFKSYSELRTKVSKGELKAATPFPEKGTDEQKAQWRADQGIPDKPDAYQLKPPPGVVIGEEDKPFIEGFLKHAHERNMTPDAVNNAVAWWGEERIRRQESAAAEVARIKQETSDALHAEWGTEYRPTINKVQALLDGMVADEALKTAIHSSVETNPGFAKFLANVATQLNPTSTLVFGDGGGNVNTISEWLERADKTMRTNRKDYDKKYSNDYQNYAAAYQRQTGKEWGR
jgi:hypothetical protein